MNEKLITEEKLINSLVNIDTAEKSKESLIKFLDQQVAMREVVRHSSR